MHVFAETAFFDGDALPGYKADYLFIKLLGQRRLGWGEVDAQCKTLVQARCKQAGMRRDSEALEPLLRVRCALKDGRCRCQFSHWPANFCAWQARRKRLHRPAA